MTTRIEFIQGAKALPVLIGQSPWMAEPKQFKTGSLGWWTGGKINLTINGKIVACQMTCSIIVIGSKEIPAQLEEASA